MLRLASLLLALVVVSSYAADDDEFVIERIAKTENRPVEEVRKDYNNGCASGVTPSMLTCRYYHRLASDIRLNKYYGQLRKQLGKGAAGVRLVQAQKAWLAFRDANCAYEGIAYVAPQYRDFSDPRDKREVVEACASALTDERVKWLKDYVACPTIVCPDN